MRTPTQRAAIDFLILCLMALCASAAVAGNAKVQVCHLPPGNPANFHTIKINENALPAHLGHGDLPGVCFEHCDVLCDDGDACTVDACDAETEICLIDHPPVNCDDGDLCTSDSCDPADGCQYAPISCDDGDACTVDACNPYDGQCTGTPIDCGPLGACLSETGQCDFPCDGIICEALDQCHEPGECVLPGTCVEGAQLADGTACDDGDSSTVDDRCTGGVCAGSAPSDPLCNGVVEGGFCGESTTDTTPCTRNQCLDGMCVEEAPIADGSACESYVFAYGVCDAGACADPCQFHGLSDGELCSPTGSPEGSIRV